MAWIKKRGQKHQVLWRDLAGKECARTCPTARIAHKLKCEVEETLALGRDWQPKVTSEDISLRNLAIEKNVERKRILQRRALLIDEFIADEFEVIADQIDSSIGGHIELFAVSNIFRERAKIIRRDWLQDIAVRAIAESRRKTAAKAKRK